MSSVKLDKKKNSDLFEPQLLENNIKLIWKIFSKNRRKTPIFFGKIYVYKHYNWELVTSFSNYTNNDIFYTSKQLKKVKNQG